LATNLDKPSSEGGKGKEFSRVTGCKSISAHLPKENTILLAAGFELTEGADLCRREGNYYGREAALQIAFKERDGFGELVPPGRT
jgi:hypothetical protein